jgi:hypothetical protein
MKMTSFVCVLFLLVAGLAISPIAIAQSLDSVNHSDAPLSVEEIVSHLVQRNLERSNDLSAYQSTRIYRLEYQGFPGARSAEAVVDVNYRSPGTKEFTIRSAKGSKLILDKVFKRMFQSEKEALTEQNQNRIALNQNNYTFSLIGQEVVQSGPAYVLSVEPRTDNKLLYRGQIWVDAQEFAVVRIQAAPAKNPSFWTKESKIEQLYTKVGKFWLPSSNRSTSTIRLGGKAHLSIDYQDYRVTAIKDLHTVAGRR